MLPTDRVARFRERYRAGISPRYSGPLHALWVAAVGVSGVVAYALSPIDLIPDFIPVLGLLVLCVLIFTSFFREGEGGFLHQFKGTVGAIVTPLNPLLTPELNAFAAPGGYVFITRGLLLRMRNEAELAGVLAHDAFLDANKDHWLANEIRHLWKRVLKRSA